MSSLLAATTTAAQQSTGETLVFWVCAIVAVCGALGMLFSKKAVHSALFIASTMMSLAVLYVALQAPFLGMVQVVVYTGAVMMLFLFVLMIVGVDSSDSLVETIKGQRIAAIVVGIAFAALLIAGIGSTAYQFIGLDAANAADGGNVQGIAHLIFTKYLLAFELTSALLITAAMGAMVLAHRERWTNPPKQKDLSIDRFLGDGHPGNLPNPGVYARHNAVSTPALLPDGTPLEESIPAPVRARMDAQPVDHADVRDVHEIAEGAGE